MPHGYPPWSGIKKKTVFAIPIDLAELAARLGSIVTFDRRGDVFHMEDFRGGIAGWLSLGGGDDSTLELSVDSPKIGGFSMKLVPGDAALDFMNAYRYMVYPKAGRLGLELSFTVNASTHYIRFLFHIYDGVNLSQAGIEYDHANTRLRYRDSGGEWQVEDSDLELSTLEVLFHTIKLVVDTENGKYLRLILDSLTYNLSAYDLDADTDPTVAHLYLEVQNVAADTSQPAIYVDDVIVTQNEP